MSAHYRPVQWTRVKMAYDAVLVLLVLGYVVAYQLVSKLAFRGTEALSEPILAMRAWGSCAFLLLSLILCIGPLARLDGRFLPLLYNRRHAGVVMAIVAVVHATQVLGFYFAYGKEGQLEALFTYDARFTPASVPFIVFGVLALVIIVVMASTSHDFWQRFLGPTTWKSLHMLVYLAYTLVVTHVAFGALQRESKAPFAVMFVVVTLTVAVLHVLAARRSTVLDRSPVRSEVVDDTPWVDACGVDEIPVDHAKPVRMPEGERVAIVNKDGELYALHGVCAHQGGPLYEGRVKDGCLTCPWHGWQYRPEDGRSPPPFEEVLPTYRLRLKNGRVLVDPRPLAPGTPTRPVTCQPAACEEMHHVHA